MNDWPTNDPDFMTSLARGLDVLHCFAERQRPMTIADAARATGLSRAAVRRCLHTLRALGYVAPEGQLYMLQPKVLALGYAYLSSSPLPDRAQPLLEKLRDELGESCSLGVMEGDEVYYVVRAEASRIMAVGLRVGARLPLYCTSMGRVLLAGQPREEQEAYLARAELVQRTPYTVTELTQLRQKLRDAADHDFAIIDQELEIGLRSIAVAVKAQGKTVAAVNVGLAAQRAEPEELRARFLPALRRVAEALRT